MNKCPICGSNGQLLFSSFECKNSSCNNFVKSSNFTCSNSFKWNEKDLWPDAPIIPVFTNWGIISHLVQHKKFGGFITEVNIKGPGPIIKLDITMSNTILVTYIERDIEYGLSEWMTEIQPAGVGIKWSLKFKEAI